MATPRSLVLMAGTLLLAACTQPAPDAQAPAPQPAAAVAAPAPRVPAATDEAGLRDAASRALAEQRLYAPAGDNAVEHYLALRRLVPGDANIGLALLELLPYALIGSEQAIARGNFDEAARLLALVQQVDASLPALSRLRDQLAVARTTAERAAQAAEQLAREAAARQAATASAPVEASSARTSSAGAASAIVDAAGPSSPPTAAPPVSAPAPAPAPSAAPVAAASSAPARPSPAPAAELPRLVSAPPPRYPLMAQRRKLEGDVVLELRIEPDGRVGSVRVLSATAPGLFDEAAIAAATRWRFAPLSAPATTRQVLQFRLPKEG